MKYSRLQLPKEVQGGSKNRNADDAFVSVLSGFYDKWPLIQKTFSRLILLVCRSDWIGSHAATRTPTFTLSYNVPKIVLSSWRTGI
jgi:hypothetical protein